MAISKNEENGTYEVFVKVRDNTGKQVGARRMGIKSEREAKRIEFELKNELEGFKKKMPWPRWVEHFLERYKVEYRNSTYVNYKFNLDKWVNSSWEKRFLDEITPSDVHKMTFEHIKDVSSHHRNGILKIIKRVFQMAIEEGVLAKNPAAGIKVRVLEANQKVLNKKEIDILLREAKGVGHRFYPHWALAILTGMRSGELHALRWTDVDFETGLIKICKSWTRLNGEGPTKTAKNRAYPMSKECRKFLQELKLKSEGSEFVLSRQWEWDHGNQGQILREFCQGIGITTVKFHDLRATFITQMLSNGVALSKVMAIVGHSSLKTTQGYLRLSGMDIEGATESLNIKLPEEANVGGGKVIAFNRD